MLNFDVNMNVHLQDKSICLNKGISRYLQSKKISYDVKNYTIGSFE